MFAEHHNSIKLSAYSLSLCLAYCVNTFRLLPQLVHCPLGVYQSINQSHSENGSSEPVEGRASGREDWHKTRTVTARREEWGEEGTAAGGGESSQDRYVVDEKFRANQVQILITRRFLCSKFMSDTHTQKITQKTSFFFQCTQLTFVIHDTFFVNFHFKWKISWK